MSQAGVAGVTSSRQVLERGDMCSSEEPMVIILIKTKLADTTTTLDRDPVTKTVFTHSLTQSAQTTTRRAPFVDGNPIQSPVQKESLST